MFLPAYTISQYQFKFFIITMKQKAKSHISSSLCSYFIFRRS